LIRIIVDDLAFLEVDAVVRPADQVLEPASSSAARMDHMAGEEFIRQCRVSSPLEVGSAVVTGSGELAAGYVIHLVIKGDEINAGRDTVERALQSAWHRANEWQLARVATPLVGAGVGQLTLEDAAGLLKHTLAKRPQTAYPSEVQVVLDREHDRDLVTGILEQAAV
jgi:O-acetyl-ADP-ribose deacetylase (regulator of RNase III)